MLKEGIDCRVFNTVEEDIVNTDNDSVIFHIMFAERVCILTKTLIVFSNKPWFKDEVRLLCRKKYEALKNSISVQYNHLKYESQRLWKK